MEASGNPLDRPLKPLSDIETFNKLDIRVGRVMKAALNEKARKPAYVLEIDFGPLGILTSSAQITELYNPEDLIDRQIIAVVNFPPRRVAGVKSECLVLGALGEKGVVLLETEHHTKEGTSIA